MQLLESMLNEIREEAATTKRVLDRVPAEKLLWKPHVKSMSLGQLALHVASIPGSLARLTQLDEFDASQANFDPPVPKDAAEIHATLEESVRAAEAHIRNLNEQTAWANWRLTLKRQGNFQQAAHRSPSVYHAEPLVSPPGRTVGLPTTP